MIKINKDLVLAYIFGVLAIIIGLKIIFTGKDIGASYGSYSYDVFEGFERLYGLYPIGFGLLIIFGARYNHRLKKDNKDDKSDKK